MRTNRIFGLVLVGAVAAIGALLVGNVRIFHFGPAAPAVAASRLVPGTRAAFAYLAKQTSNSCGLQPATVQSYPDTARIQGSCCSAMDWHHYQAQVRGLRLYSGMRQIPKDPYDISAARRDLGYKPTITVAEGIERTLSDLTQLRAIVDSGHNFVVE